MFALMLGEQTWTGHYTYRKYVPLGLLTPFWGTEYPGPNLLLLGSFIGHHLESLQLFDRQGEDQG